MKIVIVILLLLISFGRVYAEPLGSQAYGLLKTMYTYDKTYPLNAARVGTVSKQDVIFEKIVFDSFHDGKVPGLIAVPTQGDGPFPIVLLLHGVTGNKSQWLGNTYTHGGEVAFGLLKQGYAVMALDAQYHGDRAVYNNYLDVGEMVFKNGWGVRYANLLTQSVVDYRRAIDYLETREDIDTSRIGVLGYSMGGHMSFILGAVEPRIQATVTCVAPYMEGMPMAPLAFARDMGNDPLLMLMAKKDEYYTIEQAQAVFDEVPGDNKTLTLFDSGHSLPAEYTQQAVEWLSRNL